MGLEYEISSFGTILALFIAIFLIMKRVSPPYAMMAGAVIGGLVGGLAFTDTVSVMIDGAKGMTGVVLRVLAAGILAGVLIESGAAKTIAESILMKLGEKKALLAIAVATMILTGVGVFIGVAVLTVAPIAMAIAKKANISKFAVLLAISGGGKVGNIISPNPNTIAASEAFKVPLTSVMVAGLIPAIIGVFATFLIAKRLKSKGSPVQEINIEAEGEKKLPSLFQSLSGPLIAIILLLMQPLAGIKIDPLIALPIGGILGAFIMKKHHQYLNQYVMSGLEKMTGVSILLLGTGTLAGIIANSNLIDLILNSIDSIGLPAFVLAPIAGITMSAATGSTSAATAVAGSAFAPVIIELGVKPLSAAAMVHAGATVLDHLPHGTYFHITRQSVNMDMKERLKLLPYETLIGIIVVFTSIVIYGLM